MIMVAIFYGKVGNVNGKMEDWQQVSSRRYGILKIRDLSGVLR